MHCRTAAALFLHAEEKQLFSLTAGEPPHCVDAICEPPGAVTTQRGICSRPAPSRERPALIAVMRPLRPYAAMLRCRNPNAVGLGSRATPVALGLASARLIESTPKLAPTSSHRLPPWPSAWLSRPCMCRSTSIAGYAAMSWRGDKIRSVGSFCIGIGRWQTFALTALRLSPMTTSTKTPFGHEQFLSTPVKKRASFSKLGRSLTLIAISQASSACRSTLPPPCHLASAAPSTARQDSIERKRDAVGAEARGWKQRPYNPRNGSR